MNVGIDHDTAAFAAASIRRWWQARGRFDYPDASRLMITPDAGGSNSYRLWKSELAAFAAEAGLAVTVCHFPPGTSKRNKIEHRLFSHITMNWRGRPLTSHQAVLNTIAATTTATGLRVETVLDEAAYPTGIAVTREQLQALPITVHDRRGIWNYTIATACSAAPRPAARHLRPRLPPEDHDGDSILATILYQRRICGLDTLAELFASSRSTLWNAINDVQPILDARHVVVPQAEQRFTTTAGCSRQLNRTNRTGLKQPNRTSVLIHYGFTWSAPAFVMQSRKYLEPAHQGPAADRHPPAAAAGAAVRRVRVRLGRAVLDEHPAVAERMGGVHPVLDHGA